MIAWNPLPSPSRRIPEKRPITNRYCDVIYDVSCPHDMVTSLFFSQQTQWWQNKHLIRGLNYQAPCKALCKQFNYITYTICHYLSLAKLVGLTDKEICWTHFVERCELQVTRGRDHHCDVISDAKHEIHPMMKSNVRYVSIASDC